MSARWKCIVLEKSLGHVLIDSTLMQGRILGFFPEGVLRAFSKPEGVQSFSHIFDDNAHSNAKIPPEITNLHENVRKHCKPPCKR